MNIKTVESQLGLEIRLVVLLRNTWLVWTLLGSLISSSAGAEKSVDCLHEVQRMALQATKNIDSEVARDFGISVDRIRDQIKNLTFVRTVSPGSVVSNTDLTIEYSVEGPSKKLLAYHSIEPVDDHEANAILTWVQEYQVIREDGLPLFSKLVRTTFDQQCLARQTAYIRDDFFDGGDQVRLVRKGLRSGRTIDSSWSINSEFLRNAGLISVLVSTDASLLRLREILKGEQNANFTFAKPSNEEPTTVNIAIEPDVFIRRFNPVLKRIETYSGVRLKFLGSDQSIELSKSTQSPFRLKTTSYQGNVYSVDEELTLQIWEEQSFHFNTEPESNIKMIGFSPYDQFKRALTYDIRSSAAQPRYFNSEAYFSVEHLSTQPGKWLDRVHVLEASPPKNILKWHEKTDNDVEPYLMETRYMQFEPLKSVAEAVRSHLDANADRIAAAQEISRQLGQVLAYDHSAITDGDVHLLNTADIMRNKSGVCQHYSAAFVAVARQLGIPSRIVAGYYLTPEGALGHAWVEIEINRNRWWPIDPQVVATSLTTRSYLPIGPMYNYESPANDHNAYVRLQIKYDEMWSHLLKATITRVSDVTLQRPPHL